jgi:hypothetical protein
MGDLERHRSGGSWAMKGRCRYCRGAIAPPRRVCHRCVEHRGRLTVREWFRRLTAKRSRILIDNRLANDLEQFEREVDRL